MDAVRSARFLVGLTLAASPALCFAQGQAGAPPASSGATVVETGTGTVLMDRLAALAEGALSLEEATAVTKWDQSWPAETKRYTERSAELRARCHEEIRSANRDTIVGKASQCLRSDLLLEITHRRKQADRHANMRGVDAARADGAVDAINAWIGAASAIVDGIDAGVFATVDTLKEAKRNLYQTYRVPMHVALLRVRASRGLHLLSAVARAVHGAMADDGARGPFLETFVACLEGARVSLAAAEGPGGSASDLRAGLETLRSCIDLADRERGR